MFSTIRHSTKISFIASGSIIDVNALYEHKQSLNIETDRVQKLLENEKSETEKLQKELNEIIKDKDKDSKQVADL